MGHYFFSYLLTWEVDLIEILGIMAQMWQYVIFLSLKPTKVTSVFILILVEKRLNIKKKNQNLYIFYMDLPIWGFML